jgi:hypothetical protein
LNGFVEDYKKKTYFYPIRIRSIHNNDRQMVEFTEPNNVANVCIKFNNSKETLTLNQIRKGLIISDKSLINNVFFKFKALIKIFNTNTVSKSGAYPIDIQGNLVNKKYNYPYLLENYPDANCRIFNSTISDITQISYSFYVGTARCSTQVNLTQLT